jgi:hypothetical protein
MHSGRPSLPGEIARPYSDKNKVPALDRGLIRASIQRKLSRMEYQGIRYTIRAGIERGQWSVVIYPQGVETTGVKIFGTRDYAERHARRLIRRWLQPKSQQASLGP